MYDGAIPDIDEECIVSDGKYISRDTWVEYEIGVGFEDTDAPCWWMPLPELPEVEND